MKKPFQILSVPWGISAILDHGIILGYICETIYQTNCWFAHKFIKEPFYRGSFLFLKSYNKKNKERQIMRSDPIPEEWANKIYDILVEHAGASESLREMFLVSEAEGTEEFRFQGLLGFGGKFRNRYYDWFVNYYPEDKTNRREEIESKTNDKLRELYKEYLKNTHEN